jgi:long-chain acyl-CoA synthetase
MPVPSWASMIFTRQSNSPPRASSSASTSAPAHFSKPPTTSPTKSPTRSGSPSANTRPPSIASATRSSSGPPNTNGHTKKSAHHSLNDIVADAPARPPTLPVDPDDTALLQPTGGTTGTLKLAELSHRALISNATQVATCMRCAQGQERILALLPLFHVYALTTCLLTGILSAAKIILLTRFNARQTLATLQHHRPTIFPTVPLICDKLSDELQRTAQRLPSDLRVCLSGAAPLPSKIADRFEQLSGVEITEGYGLTEAGPVTHANLTGHRRVGSIGIPLPDTRTRIADLDNPDRDVPLGQPGELLIAGPQLMSRYHANPDQTARALSVDPAGITWLHTGDIATMDSDGYFFIVDRKKDMIIRSGLKVYPARVEDVIKNCPGVSDCAVFGRPDLTHAETVIAAIVAAQQTDFAQLRARLLDQCHKHLAPYEVPSEFEQVDLIPRTPLGKIQKSKLRHDPAPAPSAPPQEQEVA